MEISERFDRTPANFRALRDMVGFKQETFADFAGVDRSVVRRWEAGKEQITEAAWRILENLCRDHFEAVEDCMPHGEDADPEKTVVQLMYYRSADDYKSDMMDWMAADTAARAAAERLLELGYKVEFVYPKK